MPTNLYRDGHRLFLQNSFDNYRLLPIRSAYSLTCIYGAFVSAYIGILCKREREPIYPKLSDVHSVLPYLFLTKHRILVGKKKVANQQM